MRCNPEKLRTSCSRYSFGWIVVIEYMYIQWENFHSFRSIKDDTNNPITAQLSRTLTMQGATRQIATAFHYKITVSNESWWHVAALSKSGKILSVALQLTQLTTTSKYLCSRFEGSLLLHRSKSTNSSTKWQPPWRIVDLNRKIILFLPTDLIEDSVIIICCDLKVVCQFISPLAPLRPVVGLRPPSNSFILSFRLTMPAAFQNTTPCGVLSPCWCPLTLTLTTSIGIW